MTTDCAWVSASSGWRLRRGRAGGEARCAQTQGAQGLRDRRRRADLPLAVSQVVRRLLRPGGAPRAGGRAPLGAARIPGSGTAGLTALGAGGAKFTIWYMSAVTFSPLNGAAPVSIS